MAQDVEAARGRHLPRHRPRILGIEHAERWLQPAAGDAGLCVKLGEVEDRDTGCLAACAGRRWNRDQRLQRPRYRHRLADRRVDVIEKISRRIRRVQIDGLGRVDHRPATDSDDPVSAVSVGELNRVAERSVGGLDAHTIVDHGLDARGFKRGEHILDGWK